MARVLAYVTDGLVLSKKEGGEWALNHVHERYHSLIKDALTEYVEDSNKSYDTNKDPCKPCDKAACRDFFTLLQKVRQLFPVKLFVDTDP
ncbi:MAG: DUF4111 domain-containing protein [Lachnospiraceae bacterium]|nr:DUF4111 domain-containing protein [Lachnospiraceae bacterium]